MLNNMLNVMLKDKLFNCNIANYNITDFTNFIK